MSYWRLFYHVIWGTRERLPLIVAEVEAPLHAAVADKARKMEAIVHAVGGVEDHV